MSDEQSPVLAAEDAEAVVASAPSRVGSYDTAGPAYAELIGEQLRQEGVWKSSLEQRGISVISTSGILVTLLFGLAAVVTDSTSFTLPFAAKVLLLISMAMFVAAAIGGIICNWPYRYGRVKSSMLDLLIHPTVWQGSYGSATRRTAEARVAMIARARKSNATKARALLWAIVAEVLAVLFVAAAVGLILFD